MIQEKPWPTNERFLVRSNGTVFDTLKNKDVKIHIASTGYAKVTLVVEEYESWQKTKRYPFISLHRLIAQAFIENQNELPEVNHKDRNKLNNDISNLEWISHRDNIIHSFTIRSIPKGPEHWNYGKKLSKEQRNLMSLQKQGTNHPKFKGYYSKDNIKYSSASQAQAATGINQRTIIRLAKANRKGWSFIPALID